MRSDDINMVKERGHIRILFVGDSVTYGTTYIDQSKIFTSLVAQNLPGLMGCAVDILNVSAGGWAPGNEIGFIKSKGIFDADLVLVVLNTGDLTQPFADFQPSPNYPTERPLTAIGETWSRYVAPRLFAGYGEVADPGSFPAESEDMASETKAVLATLDEGRNYALAHNAKFGIVYEPSHSKIWDGVGFEAVKNDFGRWISANKVPLIDLTSDLEKYPLGQVYLEKQGGDSFIHLTSFGHGVAAARLVSALPAILGTSTSTCAH
jgi:lysophospholipase L1-like esterase